MRALSQHGTSTRFARECNKTLCKNGSVEIQQKSKDREVNYRSYRPDETPAIESFFTTVFANSETEAEGLMIGKLAKELIGGTKEGDLYGFVGEDRGSIVASILFSRLTFPADVSAFLLAPVAVHSDQQGKGIGQRLINHGLDKLRSESVGFAITYGDPGFYTRVGFSPISHEVILPPFVLSHPEGWLGQSLADVPIGSLAGKCSCVPAFNDPGYW